MEWLPTLSEEISTVAVPVLLSAREPNALPSTLKVTVPVGVPEAADTVAVSVTSWPKTVEAGDRLTAVAVGPPTTVTTRGRDGVLGTPCLLVSVTKYVYVWKVALLSVNVVVGGTPDSVPTWINRFLFARVAAGVEKEPRARQIV